MLSRYLLLAAGLLAAVSLDPALAKDRGDFLNDRGETGPARLSVLYVVSEGWAHHDQDGQPVGVAIELMQRFAGWAEAEHGIALELDFEQESDWPVFYRRVRDASGGVFGLGNVTITEARREELAFSPPYVNNVAVLISHADDGQLEQVGQLSDVFAGQRAMAFAGTLHETRLRALAEAGWPDLPMDFSRSNDEILANAAAGSHFAYIDGYNYYRAVERGLPLQRHPAFDDPGETFGIIMPLNNDWQPLVEAFFAAENGVIGQAWYRDSLQRHLGHEIAGLLAPLP